MKKILYSIFSLAIASTLFVSCGSDDDGATVAPVSDAYGIYEGTWTVKITVKSSDGTTTTSEEKEEELTGRIILSKGSGDNATNVNYKIDYNGQDVDFLNAPGVGDVPKVPMSKVANCVMNIAATSNGYTLFNYKAITESEEISNIPKGVTPKEWANDHETGDIAKQTTSYTGSGSGMEIFNTDNSIVTNIEGTYKYAVTTLKKIKRGSSYVPSWPEQTDEATYTYSFKGIKNPINE